MGAIECLINFEWEETAKGLIADRQSIDALIDKVVLIVEVNFVMIMLNNIMW